MGDSFLAQQLINFCDTSHPVAICHRPFVVEINSQLWSVAAGGPYMFAVKGTSSWATHPMYRGIGVPPIVTKLLTTTPIEAEEVDTDRLKEWAGDPSPQAQETRGVLFSMVFDLRLLARLLQHIPFKKLTLWDVTTICGVRCLGIESKSKWRAMLCGLDGTPSDEKVFDCDPVKTTRELISLLPPD